LDVASRKLEMGAQLVNHMNKGIQTGVFTPGGTLIVSRAGDDAETADPMFGIETFENPGQGANAIFVGAVAHCNTSSGEDGIGDRLAIIHKGEVVERPGSTGGALFEALAEGKCR
jgi:hypothetical protein